MHILPVDLFPDFKLPTERCLKCGNRHTENIAT